MIAESGMSAIHIHDYACNVRSVTFRETARAIWSLSRDGRKTRLTGAPGEDIVVDVISISLLRNENLL